ncbi:MAG: LysE family transporter [Treponema sp.]|nr:LysE family transporter [Treponema sp.]
MFLWIQFLSYIFIMAFTPGPNNIMSMNNAAKAGFRKGMVFNCGIFAGIFIVMVLCTIFSTVLYTNIPRIQFPMKMAGAGYMLYLIIKMIVPSKFHEVKNTNGSFFVGAVLQLLNPKLMLYGITAMSSYILPHYTAVPVLAAFDFLLAFVAFVSTICWALFGSIFSILFSKHGKILNAVMIVLLLYCIVSLFL